MNMESQQNWELMNKKYLITHLELLRQSLKRAGGMDTEEDSPSPVLPSDEEHHVSVALDILVTLFDLSDFERDILLLCAGVELDSEFPSLCAMLQGNASLTFPTFQLALSVLSRPHWSALTPGCAVTSLAFDRSRAFTGADTESSPYR